MSDNKTMTSEEYQQKCKTLETEFESLAYEFAQALKPALEIVKKFNKKFDEASTLTYALSRDGNCSTQDSDAIDDMNDVRYSFPYELRILIDSLHEDIGWSTSSLGC